MILKLKIHLKSIVDKFSFILKCIKIHLSSKDVFISHIKEYIEEIKKKDIEIRELQRTIEKLDRNTSLDVRSQISLVDKKMLEGLCWIRVKDNRMLRHETFNQIRDYMRGNGIDNSLLIVTGDDKFTFQELTETDLERSGLIRIKVEN